MQRMVPGSIRQGSRGGGARGTRPCYFRPKFRVFKGKTGAPGGGGKSLDNGAPSLLKITGSAPEYSKLIMKPFIHQLGIMLSMNFQNDISKMAGITLMRFLLLHPIRHTKL